MTDYLLDTNILLRVVQPCLTPQVFIEFWAVVTRPIEANGLNWSPALAEAEIQQWQAQFPVLDDRPEIWTNWLKRVGAYAVRGKQVHDARLVAVMDTYGLDHLLTFNIDDFRRYQTITLVHPDDLVGSTGVTP
jgi:predicted nucleic acid-binding protein